MSAREVLSTSEVDLVQANTQFLAVCNALLGDSKYGVTAAVPSEVSKSVEAELFDITPATDTETEVTGFHVQRSHVGSRGYYEVFPGKVPVWVERTPRSENETKFPVKEAIPGSSHSTGIPWGASLGAFMVLTNRLETAVSYDYKEQVLIGSRVLPRKSVRAFGAKILQRIADA